jgi:hypothetical protein
MKTKNQSRPKPASASSPDDRLRRLLDELIEADAEVDRLEDAYGDAIQRFETIQRRADRLIVKSHPGAVVSFRGKAFTPDGVAMPNVPEAVHLD